MSDTNIQWLQDTINREIRQFVFTIARDKQFTEFNFQKYLDPIQLKIPDEQKPVRKIPKQHQRCQARIIKGGLEEQCSHRSSSNIFCLTHAKAPLRYGLITEPIPSQYQHLFKTSTNQDSSKPRLSQPETELLPDTFIHEFDIALLPLGKQFLKPLRIITLGGNSQSLLQDPITKYLYTNDTSSPKYIGQIANGSIIR